MGLLPTPLWPPVGGGSVPSPCRLVANPQGSLGRKHQPCCGDRPFLASLCLQCGARWGHEGDSKWVGALWSLQPGVLPCPLAQVWPRPRPSPAPPVTTLVRLPFCPAGRQPFCRHTSQPPPRLFLLVLPTPGAAPSLRLGPVSTPGTQPSRAGTAPSTPGNHSFLECPTRRAHRGHWRVEAQRHPRGTLRGTWRLAWALALIPRPDPARNGAQIPPESTRSPVNMEHQLCARLSSRPAGSPISGPLKGHWAAQGCPRQSPICSGVSDSPLPPTSRVTGVFRAEGQ